MTRYNFIQYEKFVKYDILYINIDYIKILAHNLPGPFADTTVSSEQTLRRLLTFAHCLIISYADWYVKCIPTLMRTHMDKHIQAYLSCLRPIFI